MNLVCNRAPVPSDYFGVLWALAGIKNALVLEHGAVGTNFYNSISFGVMNKQSPKGLTFSTGLEEDDVVMGSEEKIIKATIELDQKFKPEMISLVATAVTSVIGLDLDGIIEEIQPQIDARLLAFPGGGFRGSYVDGIKEVFNKLASEVAMESAYVEPGTVNILGPTIDSFNGPSDINELIRLLKLLGIKVNTVFTAGSSVLEIQALSSAALNIVTRDIALDSAKILENRFGTPYIYGLPFGIRGTLSWIEEVANRTKIAVPHDKIAEDICRYGRTLSELASVWQKYNHLKVVIASPYDYAFGLTSLITSEWDLEVVLVSLPLDPESVDAEEKFNCLGVSRLLVTPDEAEFMNVVSEIKPHIIFGDSYSLNLAPEVPIHIHAAMPAYDHLTLYDGTPFCGLKGNLYLIQTLLNEISKQRCVLLS